MDLISPLSNANYYTCRLVDLVIFVSILACNSIYNYFIKLYLNDYNTKKRIRFIKMSLIAWMLLSYNFII